MPSSPTNQPPPQRMVRVLIVAPAPLGEARIGGIANFIRGFVRHMPADFEAEIVGIGVGDEDAGSEWREIAFAGRRVRFLPVARIPRARRSGRIPAKARIVAGMLRHRRRIATAGRVAQVHAPGMDLGLAGHGVPTVRVVHNAPADLARNRAESAWRRFAAGLHLVERLTFRRAALVYFVNRATHDEYAARMPGAAPRMRYLPNFVDTTVFTPVYGDEREATRGELGVQLGADPDVAWLLFAGRLDPQKDPLLAIRVFAAAASHDTAPAARALLVMAGEGGLRGEAERLAQALGVAPRVLFTGTLPHETVARLMSVADAFLLTSAFEAGPTVVYEALAAGLPIVSTKVGEVPRLVAQDETGWLANPSDEEGLASGIRWALGQDRSTLARRCAESMRPYHLETVLAPFYAEHRRLAEASTPGGDYHGRAPDPSTEST